CYYSSSACLSNTFAILVVGIHCCDKRFAALIWILCEQPELRSQVLLHGPMVIQMVLREVREDRGVVFASLGARLIQSVGRDLHCYRVRPSKQHIAEEPLELVRLRCCAV